MTAMSIADTALSALGSFWLFRGQTAALQRGQQALRPCCCSQGWMQLEWKLCLQGSCVNSTSSSKLSRHTQHMQSLPGLQQTSCDLQHCKLSRAALNKTVTISISIPYQSQATHQSEEGLKACKSYSQTAWMCTLWIVEV